MQAGRPQGLPLQGDIQRVVGKDGLLVVVTLVEAYAPAAAQVDGRYYLYWAPFPDI